MDSVSRPRKSTIRSALAAMTIAPRHAESISAWYSPRSSPKRRRYRPQAEDRQRRQGPPPAVAHQHVPQQHHHGGTRHDDLRKDGAQVDGDGHGVTLRLVVVVCRGATSTCESATIGRCFTCACARRSTRSTTARPGGSGGRRRGGGERAAPQN